MTSIFTYGSLMFHDVWSVLVKGNYTSQKATLAHYTRRCVKNDEYPVIFKGGENVEGVVYTNISNEDMAILDAFEGEFYQRITVDVQTQTQIIQADVYVLKEEYFHIIEDKPWDVKEFATTGIKCFLANYKGFA